MLNSKPNNTNYHQGNYIPKYKDKVLKLNSQGGIYYRSSWEVKIMTWLDNNSKITRWGAECVTIPYQLTHYERNGDINLKNHCYYPDFYYEIDNGNNTTKKVIAEVKPMKEYLMVQKLQEMKLSVPENATLKKLKNFEYDLKMAQKNSEKWKTMIKYCDLKGWDFIIITEEHLKKMGLL
jgi:hypothetical protein